MCEGTAHATIRRMKRHYEKPIIAALIVTNLGTAGLSAFLYQKLQSEQAATARLTDEKTVLNQTGSEWLAALNEASSTTSTLRGELADLTKRYEALGGDYEAEKNKNEDFEDQIHKITKTVGTLDKLSKTDKELLQKYSKVYFLNENYIPSKLTDIDTSYLLPGRQTQQFHTEALPFLTDMLDDAADDGIDLKVVSAYRSFTEQGGLKGAYTQTYGTGANAFSADQGYSEHQLGTTLDLSDLVTNGPYVAFKNTEGYAWLLINAYKHGFILSYPEGNGYYIYEPWHWRFVGEDLAKYLHDNDLNFYDLDQRTIDTYLVKIFD